MPTTIIFEPNFANISANVCGDSAGGGGGGGQSKEKKRSKSFTPRKPPPHPLPKGGRVFSAPLKPQPPRPKILFLPTSLPPPRRCFFPHTNGENSHPPLQRSAT